MDQKRLSWLYSCGGTPALLMLLSNVNLSSLPKNDNRCRDLYGSSRLLLLLLLSSKIGDPARGRNIKHGLVDRSDVSGSSLLILFFFFASKATTREHVLRLCSPFVFVNSCIQVLVFFWGLCISTSQSINIREKKSSQWATNY